MANPNVLSEVPPISAEDSFVLFERRKTNLDFPIHIHKEFELNYMSGAAGAQRIVGDHVSEIGPKELILITGSYLEHAWMDGNMKPGSDIYEVTLQFPPDLFYGGLIDKKQFVSIKNMLETAKRGIAFGPDAIERAEPIIAQLTKGEGNFNSILTFFTLLHTLSKCQDYTVLSHSMFSNLEINHDSRRINKVMDYMKRNFNRNIRLAEMASLVNMSEPTFSRFIKMRTGQSFVACLNDIRIGAASRMLIEEPTRTISEIAYHCGFNNLSNFNRIFKKKKSYTPQEFREYYFKKKTIV